ncbi:MAG TPA: hypothetical protein VMW65_05410 [Chloroflexota bacterium]|nr:hypothetical protein [Chloroflexota bacterium]
MFAVSISDDSVETIDREQSVASTASRKIQKLQIWVEYRFGDADRKAGARVKVPLQGVTDLHKLPPTLPAQSPDLTDGVPHSLHVEVTFEGGHVAYCETGKLGGAFGSLTLMLDEILNLP